jgi:hypothetical protein
MFCLGEGCMSSYVWLSFNRLCGRGEPLTCVLFYTLGISFILGRGYSFPLLLVLLVFCASGFPVPFFPKCLGLKLVPVAFNIFKPIV